MNKATTPINIWKTVRTAYVELFHARKNFSAGSARQRPEAPVEKPASAGKPVSQS